jgi:hypothetical protein
MRDTPQMTYRNQDLIRDNVSDRRGDRNLELNHVTLIHKGRSRVNALLRHRRRFQSVTMVTLPFLEHSGARAN